MIQIGFRPDVAGIRPKLLMNKPDRPAYKK